MTPHAGIVPLEDDSDRVAWVALEEAVAATRQVLSGPQECAADVELANVLAQDLRPRWRMLVRTGLAAEASLAHQNVSASARCADENVFALRHMCQEADLWASTVTAA